MQTYGTGRNGGPSVKYVREQYVAYVGLVLYIGGDYSLHLECYVTCTICQQTSCHANT